MPTEAETVSSLSQAVSCNRQASRSLNPRRDRLAVPSIVEVSDAATDNELDER